jgi:ATP-dependent DNA ligase
VPVTPADFANLFTPNFSTSRGRAWPSTSTTSATAEIVYQQACKLGYEGIVSKRIGSTYRSGRSKHWLKVKNPKAPAVRREAEEDWRR